MQQKNIEENYRSGVRLTLNVGQATPDVKRGKMFLPKHCQVKPDLHFYTPHPTFGHPLPQGAREQRGGFTLIELLVVVLIIGILASVALPKYQLAVDKARFTKLLTPITSIAKAIDAYYLTNGTFPTRWDELDIDLPGTTNETGDRLAMGTFSLALASQGVWIRDSKIPGITLYAFSNYRTDRFAGKITCYATNNNARATMLCKNLTKKNTPDEVVSYGNEDLYFLN